MTNDLPKYLYHRTNHYSDIEGIIKKGALIPAAHLKRKETKCGSRYSEFVSLSEGKCVETGGKFQIVLDAKKVAKKNKIFNLWKSLDIKGPGSLVLHELEWRSCEPVKFNKDDINEIVLYKNYSISKISEPKLLSEHKREMTISEKGFKKVCERYNIPCRIVDIESNECNEKERIKELEHVLKRANIKIISEKPLKYERISQI